MEKQDALSAFAAIAQETRLDIFRRLVRAGDPGMSAGAIATELGVPANTLSFHLKELKSARVVRCRREGRSLIYSPDFRTMNDLLAFLTENCCESAGPGSCGSAPN